MNRNLYMPGAVQLYIYTSVAVQLCPVIYVSSSSVKLCTSGGEQIREFVTSFDVVNKQRMLRYSWASFAVNAYLLFLSRIFETNVTVLYFSEDCS